MACFAEPVYLVLRVYELSAMGIKTSKADQCLPSFLHTLYTYRTFALSLGSHGQICQHGG